MRLTGDDRHIVVADAGSPMLHIYDRGADWGRSHISVAVLDDATFLRGRASPDEGGPKGIDIDRSNSVVAVTCEEQTLAFFALRSMTEARVSAFEEGLTRP